MPKFATAFAGKFAGYKQPYEFKASDGTQVKAQGKLQFLTTDDEGVAELVDVGENQWSKATGAPPLEDLQEGTDCKLIGQVVLKANNSYFVLRAVEPLQ